MTIYLHRANFNTSPWSGKRLPLKYDYMGSTEFELGGVGQTYAHLTDNASKLITAHTQIKVRRILPRGNAKRHEKIDLWALGLPEDVSRVFSDIAEYSKREPTVHSKEWIDFGWLDEDNIAFHDTGIEIERKVFVSMRRGFVHFVQEYMLHGMIDQKPKKSGDFKMGDPVVFYDQEKDKVVFNGKVKGIPDSDDLLTVEVKKKKYRVDVRLVIPT